MDRVYNFSAGPSVLPTKVLETVASELTNYKNTGMSVMEMSHRSVAFAEIINDAELHLRQLLNIPKGYKVLFLQGGATLQFSMIPLNFMQLYDRADYVITGAWAKKAYHEAKKFGDVKIARSSADKNFTFIPKLETNDFRGDLDYIHITSNNTIYGTYYQNLADVSTAAGPTPLVADMSSEILSREINVGDFSLIYAGAQKNIGPAGLTIVIVKESQIGNPRYATPIYLDYATHTEANSLYNTPPAWSIYVAGEVFKHLLESGGLVEMEKLNLEKAKKLYDYIDESKLYTNPNCKEDRSIMNVVFVTGLPELDKKFISEAKDYGLVDLGGHRSIGGMRASIYNAMPMSGVDKLIEFMHKFENENR